MGSEKDGVDYAAHLKCYRIFFSNFCLIPIRQSETGRFAKGGWKARSHRILSTFDYPVTKARSWLYLFFKTPLEKLYTEE